jgi:hypothetical protein
MLAKAGEYLTWISATRLDCPAQGDRQDTSEFKSHHFGGVLFSYQRFGCGCDPQVISKYSEDHDIARP